MFRTIRFAFAMYCWLMASFSVAQRDKEQRLRLSNECSCSSALEQTIDKVSRIYAGFNDKVTPKTQAQYDRLVQSVQKSG
ncbi:hypothetical protein [Spirosoma validum]|uniref:Uncharacterized protein n=1 Tax=Spirosoma validum TaxID=2771355 RepID=A0A927B3X1_9BACT|nr:hypothetical protein [Spirosoma validum]MBD2754935.1 hypothetical protein [Spirosoma validum]